MAVTIDASKELIKDLEDLRNALRHLLDIVVKLYIINWYTLISPRDRTFIAAVRGTSLAYLDSIIEDLSRTSNERKLTQDRLLELAFTSTPTILERHVKAYQLAKDDSLTMDTGTTKRPENDQRPSLPDSTLLAQRYHLYAPHPGMEATAQHDSLNPSSTPEHPESVDRPSTPQGMDEILADALSSSITNLPRPQATQSSNPNLNPGEPPRNPYTPSPEYLSHLIDRILKPHLPAEDYASSAERTMITEVVGNAVLGNVLRKCAEPWFIWRIGLSLLREDEVTDGSREDAGATSSPTGGINATTALWSCIGLLTQVPGMIIAAYTYFSITLSNYLSGTSPEDPKIRTNPHPAYLLNPAYLLEPWVEASMSLTSPNSTFATQEVWTMVKMVYIATSNKIDGFVKGRFTDSLHVDTATRLISKMTDTLFPDGDLAPVVPDPTIEEAEAMREELEICLYDRLPGIARSLLLGIGETTQKRAIADAMDVFSNASANTSLLLTLTEAVLLTLVPKAVSPRELNLR